MIIVAPGQSITREGERLGAAKHRDIAFLQLVLCAFLFCMGSVQAQQREVPNLNHAVDLSGPWKFHTGDDPQWSAPDFDDSSWKLLQVPRAWGRQGYRGYSGIAWYRLTVRVPLDERSIPLSVVIGYVDSSYEIYVGGALVGGVGGLPPVPRQEYDRRATFSIPQPAIGSDGRLVIALRVWKAPSTNPALGGLNHGKSWLGPTSLIARRELISEIPSLLMSMVFLLVGLYHIHLYRSRRELKEYLWYGTLAAFNAAVYTFLISQWKFEVSDQYLLLKKLEYFAAFTSPAVFVQFLWPMLGRKMTMPLRWYQGLNVGLAIVSILTPDVTWNRALLPYWEANLGVGVAICIAVVLQEAARGVSDARTISIGIILFLAALGNDVAIDRGWMESMRLMPFGFAAFLGSMAVSLANRFTRVHAELSGLKQQLEQRVQERTVELSLRSAELSEANLKLAERSKELGDASIAKSQFLANMSHELRTPLNAIIGYSEILLEESAESGKEVFESDLKKIQFAGRHLLGLINDVLDLSKIEAGKMDLFLERFPIEVMLQELASTISPMAEKNKNLLEIDCPPDIADMRADVKRVRQVLLNLLSNACKFTQDGIVSLSVRRRMRDGAEWIEFQVRDTGIGMTRPQIDRLFQAFMQADASVTRKYGGTGLGLVISKRFCQMMGGDLTVESEHGKGSAFFVTLPSEVAQVRHELAVLAEPRAEPEISLPHDDRGIVLVIDDDRAARDLMVRMISREGFRVVTAWGGEEGLRLARDLQPFVITLDVMMPGMDGWAVLRELKSNPILAGIPVVMVTMEEDRSRGAFLGASDFMTKPIQRERLVEILNKYRKQQPV